MTDNQEPTGTRRRLGLELRNLRIRARKRNLDAAAAAGTSRAQITRLEKGMLRRFRDAEIRALLDLYGVTDPRTVRRLMDLARRARRQIWVDDYDDVIPDGFTPYIGLEADAVRIRSYTHQLVHGLLQTERYARTVIAAARPDEPAERIERLVGLRMHRQAVFGRGGTPGLWAIMEEAVLRRPIGGARVMGGQLAHLLDMARRPHVTLQVLPYSEGAHAGLDGPFTVLEFDEPNADPTVYTNSATGNHYRKDADTFQHRFDHLRAVAMPMDRTIEFIEATVKEME